MSGENGQNFETLQTALKLAGERSWQSISLIDIAEAAGTPLSDLYTTAGKPALAKQLDPWADLAMSSEASDPEDSPRERLFDVIMRRFETFETERAGVLSLMSWRNASPNLRAELLRARIHTANWALACAGLDTLGPLETRATSLGLAWVVGQTEKAWRQDEGGDFARTMATLDAELINAGERLAALKRIAPNSRRKSTKHPAKEEEQGKPEVRPAESDEA
ncbi:MAG: hypothetical protein ABJG15_13470 [Hyphomonadaceae bacterium]